MKIRSTLVAGLTAMAIAVAAVPSQAATVTYKFIKKSTLTNVDDAEGRWQFDGGEVYLGSSKVGYYTRKKRVSFGIPTSINKSSMELTVIWAWGNYNFTAQGSHYFHTGAEVGGVSATSGGFGFLNGATFTGDHNSLTFTY